MSKEVQSGKLLMMNLMGTLDLTIIIWGCKTKIKQKLLKWTWLVLSIQAVAYTTVSMGSSALYNAILLV